MSTTYATQKQRRMNQHKRKSGKEEHWVWSSRLQQYIRVYGGYAIERWRRGEILTVGFFFVTDEMGWVYTSWAEGPAFSPTQAQLVCLLGRLPGPGSGRFKSEFMSESSSKRFNGDDFLFKKKSFCHGIFIT